MRPRECKKRKAIRKMKQRAHPRYRECQEEGDRGHSAALGVKYYMAWETDTELIVVSLDWKGED